jgi:hypothetical protein
LHYYVCKYIFANFIRLIYTMPNKSKKKKKANRCKKVSGGNDLEPKSGFVEKIKELPLWTQILAGALVVVILVFLLSWAIKGKWWEKSSDAIEDVKTIVDSTADISKETTNNMTTSANNDAVAADLTLKIASADIDTDVKTALDSQIAELDSANTDIKLLSEYNNEISAEAGLTSGAIDASSIDDVTATVSVPNTESFRPKYKKVDRSNMRHGAMTNHREGLATVAGINGTASDLEKEIDTALSEQTDMRSELYVSTDQQKRVEDSEYNVDAYTDDTYNPMAMESGLSDVSTELEKMLRVDPSSVSSTKPTPDSTVQNGEITNAAELAKKVDEPPAVTKVIMTSTGPEKDVGTQIRELVNSTDDKVIVTSKITTAGANAILEKPEPEFVPSDKEKHRAKQMHASVSKLKEATRVVRPKRTLAQINQDREKRGAPKVTPENIRARKEEVSIVGKKMKEKKAAAEIIKNAIKEEPSPAKRKQMRAEYRARRKQAHLEAVRARIAAKKAARESKMLLMGDNFVEEVISTEDAKVLIADNAKDIATKQIDIAEREKLVRQTLKDAIGGVDSAVLVARVSNAYPEIDGLTDEQLKEEAIIDEAITEADKFIISNDKVADTSAEYKIDKSTVVADLPESVSPTSTAGDVSKPAQPDSVPVADQSTSFESFIMKNLY